MANFSARLLQDVDFKGWSYLAERFRQIKRSFAEQFRQIKCSLVESHAEISFWFGKGMKILGFPPLEVHFGVRGCGTDSAGGASQE